MSDALPPQAPISAAGVNDASHNMLNCQQCTMFLMAYLDNEMPAPQREAFEKHLAVCPPCVEFLKSYQATVRMCKETVLGKLCSQRKAADVPDALVKAILANRPHVEKPKKC